MVSIHAMALFGHPRDRIIRKGDFNHQSHFFTSDEIVRSRATLYDSTSLLQKSMGVQGLI